MKALRQDVATLAFCENKFSSRAFQHRCRARSALSAFQCLATKARPHLRFTTSLENEFSIRLLLRLLVAEETLLLRRSRSIMAFFAFQCSICLARKWAAVSTAFVSESPIK